MTSYTWATDLGDFLDQRSEKHQNGCLMWIASKDSDGYGRAFGKWYEIHKKTGAHQLSYIWHKGSIPAGQLVCHSCDTPACINPDHLFLGDSQMNMTDKVLKRRQPAKLVETQVLEIRSLYAAGNITQADLALDYDVSEETIRCVVNRKSWSHI